MGEEPIEETFDEFKNSFSYGSRSDMNFKFLKSLSTSNVKNFFQELLWKLGDSLNDGDFNRIVEHIYLSQAKGYAGPSRFIYETAPFAPLIKPLTEIRLALLTSSGHFVKDDDPKPFGVEAMTQKEAEARIDDFIKSEPQLSEIPMDTPAANLRVRHGGYDIRGAEADLNVNFPLTRLKELRQENLIGNLFPTAFSFVGATSQLRLLNQTGPQWVKKFKEEKIDAFLLVPV